MNATPALLVVTHGRLAEELLRAIRRIVEDEPRVFAAAIDWDDDVARSGDRIREAIETADDGAGVVVLTDMFGGTPTNLALSACEPGRVEVVTGVNLPMLVKYTNLRDATGPRELAEELAERGREAIQVASGLLERPAPAEEPS